MDEVLECNDLRARVDIGSIQSVLNDLFAQAERRGKATEFVKALLGANLEQSLADRKSLCDQSAADTRNISKLDIRERGLSLASCSFEIVMSYPPVEGFRRFVVQAKNKRRELWLLTRDEQVKAWKREVELLPSRIKEHIVVKSVTEFIAQSVSQRGLFSVLGKREQLLNLFQCYNARWRDRMEGVGVRLTE